MSTEQISIKNISNQYLYTFVFTLSKSHVLPKMQLSKSKNSFAFLLKK